MALTADNVFVSYNNGDYSGAYYFVGTSCAAPLWAGFCALVNQQSVAASGTTVGFLNPALYAIATSANYSACFHDITTGNNIGTDTPGLFYAATGYDLCTGLGTPTGTNLINALTLPPTVNFTGTPTNGTAPLTVIFTNLSTGANSYKWTLGDGHTSTSVNPANTYSNAGTYSVTLTAIGAVWHQHPDPHQLHCCRSAGDGDERHRRVLPDQLPFEWPVNRPSGERDDEPDGGYQPERGHAG